jgi:hypothetical protein
VTGWVGTVDEHRAIDETNNVVVLQAWGKLIQEDLLEQVRAGGLYTKYLLGELRADFLDEDAAPDITTSDRQRLKEDDPRYQSVREWFRTTVLREVENHWRDWRSEAALAKAVGENEALREWYDILGADNKRAAKDLFGKIGTVLRERQDERRELYKYTVLAFEKLRFREELHRIEALPDDADASVFAAVFSGIDELEAAEYHQIAKGRLEVIEAFRKIVPAERERVIQTHLFEHLWLLHPSWERASTDMRIEEAVTTEFERVTASLSDDERAGRIDIRYRTAAGKHIIIELKKYDVTVNVFDLAKQMNKYRSALLKCLRERFPDETRQIEVIAVLGRPPSVGEMNEDERDKALQAVNGRFITYDTLIQEALESYRDYLEANTRLSRISGILERI